MCSRLLLLLLPLVSCDVTTRVPIAACPKGCYHDYVNKAVSCVDSACTAFPVEMISQDEAADVEKIDVSYNQIHVLPALNFTQLEDLSLSNNAITTLHIGTFKNCPNLRKIDLSHNVLDSLFAEMFKVDFRHLEDIDLSYNRIKTIKQRTFQFLTTLQHLNLSHNRIHSLDDYALSYQYELEELHLEYNFLDKVKMEYFEGMKSLQYLSLRGNNIRFVEEDSFMDLNQLMRIDLGENKLMDIKENVFHEGLAHPFSRLQAVHLDNNQLTEIHGHTFSPFRELMYIILDDNNIEQINNTQPFPRSLQMISIQRNTQLQKILNGTFTNMPNLTEVNLSGCYKLHKIEAGAFENSKRVTKFDASQCGLYHMDESLLNWTQLVAPDLTGNPWNCDCMLKWVKDGLNSETLGGMQCHTPHQLKGLPLDQLEVDEMSCAFYARYRHMIGVVLVILTTVVFIVVTILLVYSYRQKLFPSKYKKSGGTYQTLYTVDDPDDNVTIQVDEASDATSETKLLGADPHPVDV